MLSLMERGREIDYCNEKTDKKNQTKCAVKIRNTSCRVVTLKSYCYYCFYYYYYYYYYFCVEISMLDILIQSSLFSSKLLLTASYSNLRTIDLIQ